MIELTNQANGAITIAYTAPTGAGAFSHIIRTDRNGLNAIRVLIASDDGIITDYEASAGDITYTVYWAHTSESASIRNATLDQPIIQRALRPDIYVLIDSVISYRHGRETGNIVHDTPNRRYSLISYGTAKSRDITFTMLSGSFQAARELEALLVEGGVVLLRVPEHRGMDAYFIARSTSINAFMSDGADTVWEITVDAVEVALPAGAYQADPVNNYQTDFDAYPTYIESLTDQPTYLARLEVSA